MDWCNTSLIMQGRIVDVVTFCSRNAVSVLHSGSYLKGQLANG